MTAPSSLSAASIGPMKYLAHPNVHDDANSLPSKHVVQREPFRRRRGGGQPAMVPVPLLVVVLMAVAMTVVMLIAMMTILLMMMAANRHRQGNL
jgi:hypothetical protein